MELVNLQHAWRHWMTLDESSVGLNYESVQPIETGRSEEVIKSSIQQIEPTDEMKKRKKGKEKIAPTRKDRKMVD